MERPLSMDVRSALQNREIALYIQLYANASTGQPAGGEVIPLWAHPAGGLLPGEQWLPLLEQEGLSAQLDDYVLEQVCAMLDSLGGEDRGQFFLLYRLSEQSLCSEDREERWTKLLEGVSFDRRRLVLGVPQRVVEHELQRAAHQIQAIQALEMKLVLDDFNGQLTALAQAGETQFCGIKLKGPIPQRIQSEVILRAAIRAGHEMGLAVLAEGADTEEQTARLRALGCDLLRGTQYAPLLPAREAVKTLSESASISGL